jgi:hypothetical protein
MARSRGPESPPRSVADLEDARDLRAAIDEALGADPVDERRLRDAVFTYVGAERDAGVSPGRVIFALTALVEAAEITPAGDEQAIVRDVILWCVEAYFGHLGGDVFARRVAPPAAGA